MRQRSYEFILRKQSNFNILFLSSPPCGLRGTPWEGAEVARAAAAIGKLTKPKRRSSGHCNKGQPESQRHLSNRYTSGPAYSPLWPAFGKLGHAQWSYLGLAPVTMCRHLFPGQSLPMLRPSSPRQLPVPPVFGDGRPASFLGMVAPPVFGTVARYFFF